MRLEALLRIEGPRHRGQDLRDLVGEDAAHGVVVQRLEAAAAQRADDAAGDSGPEIGGDERVLELAQRRVVELAAAERLVDAADQPVGRARQARFETLEPAHAMCPINPSASAPAMTAATIVPGAAWPSRRTRAKCSE